MNKLLINTLLWVEKYRPKNIDGIIGQDKNICILKNMIDNGSFPHLIFSGISGTGKTSTIMALSKYIYGNDSNYYITKLDASDDRGINTVREEIKEFAEKKIFCKNNIKIIILDEADAMTFDAQFALRRIIEKYSDNTRFCLICNYDNKIIPEIKSRCVNIKFNPINKDNIINRLKYICDNENIKYNTKHLKLISDLSNGDLRKAINILQSIYMRTNKITTIICYETTGYPDIKLVEYIYDFITNKENDFNSCYMELKNKIIDVGYALSLFIKQLVIIISNTANEKNIDDNTLMFYYDKLAELEYNVSNSTFGYIYMVSLIGILKKIDN
jgi:replication factor C subunit 3/5